jgi:hypothetical protein
MPETDTTTRAADAPRWYAVVLHVWPMWVDLDEVDGETQGRVLGGGYIVRSAAASEAREAERQVLANLAEDEDLRLLVESGAGETKVETREIREIDAENARDSIVVLYCDPSIPALDGEFAVAISQPGASLVLGDDAREEALEIVRDALAIDPPGAIARAIQGASAWIRRWRGKGNED